MSSGLRVLLFLLNTTNYQGLAPYLREKRRLMERWGYLDRLEGQNPIFPGIEDF
jgi:hypothetical protein